MVGDFVVNSPEKGLKRRKKQKNPFTCSRFPGGHTGGSSLKSQRSRLMKVEMNVQSVGVQFDRFVSPP